MAFSSRVLSKSKQLYASQIILPKDCVVAARYFAKDAALAAKGLKGDEMLKGIFLEVKKKFETAMGLLRQEKTTLDAVEQYAKVMKTVREKGADLFSESQRIKYTIETRTQGIQDARTFLLTLQEIRMKRGLTDDLGAEAMMFEALDKVEKQLKKPLMRNDKQGMGLLTKEFEAVNKKLGVSMDQLPKYEEELELKMAKAQLEELKKDAVDAMETQKKNLYRNSSNSNHYSHWRSNTNVFIDKLSSFRHYSTSSVGVTAQNDVVRFSFGGLTDSRVEFISESEDRKEMTMTIKKKRKSKKAKVNELRFYRLKAKKKMKSPNPEVRIRYKLEKAKRKEVWLIEKLRKFELPKAPAETYDPEILTEEEKFYLKRTGERKKHYVPVGRRGVFGGVVLNMHLHWKKHETIKVVCKPCKPGQIHEIADGLSQLSKGIVIDIKSDNTIIFYRGKNYVQPEVMSPPDTLSKNKALEKYKYQQSLDHTSEFIEKLEKELEEYCEHLARFKTAKENASKHYCQHDYWKCLFVKR